MDSSKDRVVAICQYYRSAHDSNVKSRRTYPRQEVCLPSPILLPSFYFTLSSTPPHSSFSCFARMFWRRCHWTTSYNQHWCSRHFPQYPRSQVELKPSSSTSISMRKTVKCFVLYLTVSISKNLGRTGDA